MTTTTAQKRRITRHIENMGSPDIDTSARACDYLIRYYGVRALDELLEASSHPNPIMRYRAAWALGHTHDPRAFEAILRLTDDPDEAVRYDSTIALGILDDERAIEPLKAIWLQNDDTKPACEAFFRMGPKTVYAVEDVLANESSSIRWTAMILFARLAERHGDARSIEMLETCLNDSCKGIRVDAGYRLNEIREQQQAGKEL